MGVGRVLMLLLELNALFPWRILLLGDAPKRASAVTEVVEDSLVRRAALEKAE